MKKLKVKNLTTCPFCNSRYKIVYTSLYDRFDVVGHLFDVCKCKKCEIAFTNPMPVCNIDLLYPTNYLLPATNKNFDIMGWYRNDQYRFDFDLLEDAIKAPINHIKSMLDVGCGSGERLSFAEKVGIKRVTGLDKYDNTLGKGFSNIQNLEITEYFPTKKFELVTLFHVLEHLDNPQEKLVHIRKEFLQKNGYLFIQVPNFNSLERFIFKHKWFGLDIPRHFWHFTDKSLTELLDNSGYTIVKVYKKNAILHPVTIAPSLLKNADPQRIWHNKIHSSLFLFAWVILTVLTIPFAYFQSVFSTGSMLTVVAKLD